ncbi:HDOD domain-containing protein [Shewanella marina]|uniref:HDOD domain-containing protein n=1 Tax=Shewanella marina TaxID=487319 RepID=UPI00046ECFD2|nr:HDOD domain-containing protein [Shewanella marina]
MTDIPVITEKPFEVIDFEERFFKQVLVGRKQLDMEEEEDIDEESFKLDIEREAVMARMAKQRKAKEVFEAITGSFYKTFNHEVGIQFSRPSLVFEHIDVKQIQLELLFLVSKENLEFKKIRPLVEQVDWLVEDFTKLVNSPSYRSRRDDANDVKITGTQLVLSFIGIESLASILPFYVFQHWFPHNQNSLARSSRKLWRYCLVAAIAAGALAKLHNLNERYFYICGLVNQLGMLAVLRNCASVYDHLWGNWLRESIGYKDKEIYDSVLATSFPTADIYHNVDEKAGDLTWKLLEQVGFGTNPITQTLKEFSSANCVEEYSDEGKIIAKALCYAKVYILEETKQIDLKEKRMLFEYYGISEQEDLRLQGQNFHQFDLL